MIFRSLRNSKALLYNNSRLWFSQSEAQRFNMIRNHTPLTEYSNLNFTLTQHCKNRVRMVKDQQTKLTFLIEQGGFPGCSDLGLCVKLGTQHEEPQNAGSLHYLKNYVHMKPSFEEIVENYEILNQTGSSFDMTYDVETTYFKGSFFYQDSDLMIDLLLDLAIQEKNMFQDNFQTIPDLSNINQLVRRTAFQDKGVGMPTAGMGNVLTNQQFLAFQRKISPLNTLISMSNMQDPEKIIGIIKQKIKKKYPQCFLANYLVLKRSPPGVVHSQYVGGLRKFESHDQFFEFAVAFPSASYKSEYMEMMNILRVLVGSASSFSSGGPGKGMHSRCTKNLLNRVGCVQKASFINQHYDQLGLFGLAVGGTHQEARDVIECTLNQFKRLQYQIPKEQLERAKNILITSVYSNIEKQADRLQQMSKHIYSYGRIKLDEFEGNIRKVTSSDVHKFMRQMFEKNPTFVLSGNEESLKLNVNQNQLRNKLRV